MDNKCFELGANEQPLDIIKETCGFAGIFKQIGVIGDSLASGEFESHDENGSIVYTDMYEYSWPAVLERITGTKYNNYSRGGMTAREYMQSWADTNGFWQWNQAYIIALGNNDSFVFGHPLGSVKDVNAECPQDNPAIRQSDLIVKEDYLQIGYQLEDEKEYQVGEHKFIRLILKTEGADC